MVQRLAVFKPLLLNEIVPLMAKHDCWHFITLLGYVISNFLDDSGQSMCLIVRHAKQC